VHAQYTIRGLYRNGLPDPYSYWSGMCEFAATSLGERM
jgi:hypothetical protein